MEIDYKRSVQMSLHQIGVKMTENRDLPRNDVLKLMMMVEYQIAAFEELARLNPEVSTKGFYAELHKILSIVF